MNEPGASFPTVDRDFEHLRLLAIFHYVVGGLMAFFASIFIVHFVMGAVMLAAPTFFGNSRQPGPPAFMGMFFMIIGGSVVLVGWTMAALTIYAGRCLARRRHHTLCMVAAVVCCLYVPFGTVLGVFTIIVLQRPRVKEMFGVEMLPP